MCACVLFPLRSSIQESEGAPRAGVWLGFSLCWFAPGLFWYVQSDCGRTEGTWTLGETRPRVGGAGGLPVCQGSEYVSRGPGARRRACPWLEKTAGGWWSEGGGVRGQAALGWALGAVAAQRMAVGCRLASRKRTRTEEAGAGWPGLPQGLGGCTARRQTRRWPGRPAAGVGCCRGSRGRRLQREPPAGRQKLTAPGIPRRNPTQVLTLLNFRDQTRSITFRGM